MDTFPAPANSDYRELLILLGVTGLTIPLLYRLRVTPVLGFLLCGFVMGPYGLALWIGDAFWLHAVGDSGLVERFAELGIVFLMFMIGLKLSLVELWRMRRHILGLGGSQILLTGVVVFLIALQFGNSTEMSILLGACFSVSSTAVVMQILDEKRKSAEPVGRLAFSILLMQDLAVVPALTLLSAYAGDRGEGMALLTLKALAGAAAAVVAIYAAGTKLLPPLLRHVKPGARREWLMSFVLFVVIGAAMLTEAAGMSSALGAFLAGLLLAETEHRDEVQSLISPVKNLLMGVFFLSVGMMIDARLVLDKAFWIFASVIGIGALKAVLLFLLCMAFRVERRVGAEASILLGQSGEFVFVIVTMALAAGIIPARDAQFFMVVTAISMLMTPFVALLAPALARHIGRLFAEKA